MTIQIPRALATFLLEDAFIREWKELGAEFRYVEYEGVVRGERGEEGVQACPRIKDETQATEAHR